MDIYIAMPDAEKAALLAAWEPLPAQAEAFADACVEILVTQHGARRAEIRRDILFTYAAIARLAKGAQLPTPQAAVAEAFDMFTQRALGLAGANPNPNHRSD